MAMNVSQLHGFGILLKISPSKFKFSIKSKNKIKLLLFCFLMASLIFPLMVAFYFHSEC